MGFASNHALLHPFLPIEGLVLISHFLAKCDTVGLVGLLNLCRTGTLIVLSSQTYESFKESVSLDSLSTPVSFA